MTQIFADFSDKFLLKFIKSAPSVFYIVLSGAIKQQDFTEIRDTLCRV